MIDFNPIMGEGTDKDDALLFPRIHLGVSEEERNENRRYQGIPAMERTPNGRIFFAFYTGGEDEGIGNYVVLCKTDDEGKTMEEPYLTVHPGNPETCRTFDPCLWFDPLGRLWFFLSQSFTYYDGRIGVWASICENPDDDAPVFSPFRRIANGIMMNKPIVKDGKWLLPCAIWDKFQSTYNFIPEERFSNVYVSNDNGETFRYLSSADYPDRYVDEHMIAELSDGRLMMLIRGKHGIGKAYSSNGGRSWTEAVDSLLGGPCSRFCLKKLSNGNLLLVNHYNFDKRNNLTAMISTDDGETWQGYLMIDERQHVSYPDTVEAPDGSLYIIYDHNRYDDREFLLAHVTQKDILAGKIVCDGSYLKRVLNKATGPKPV